MDIEKYANEIAENYLKDHLAELWNQAESWKRCGCHHCMLEHEKAMVRFYDEYQYVYGEKSADDNREVDYDITDEDLEERLLCAEFKEIEIPDDFDEEQLVEYFLSLKFKDVLVCFKYCGTEIWIYYDKDGRPEEYGDKS